MSTLVLPTMSVPDNLRAALDYSQHRQWPVLPLAWITDDDICGCRLAEECARPGKHPLVKNGVNDATTDLDTIMRWWARWTQANVGIRTGLDSQVLVLDVDPRSGGTESLKKLQMDYGQLPDTIVCATGGGGWHYYFRYPHEAQFRGKIPDFPGLDIKSNGGYVVAPPSRHISGGFYRWLRDWRTTAIAPLPSWLLELIRSDKKTKRQRVRAAKVPKRPQMVTLKPKASAAPPQADVKLGRYDCNLLSRLKRGNEGQRYQLLVKGDWEAAGYKSQSEADLAFFNKLARLTNGNGGRMKAIFMKTGLLRDKIIDHPTYLEMTIQMAIDDMGWHPEAARRSLGGRAK